MRRVGFKEQSCNLGPAAAMAVTPKGLNGEVNIPDTGIFHVPTKRSYPTSRWTLSFGWLSAVQFWVRLLY